MSEIKSGSIIGFSGKDYQSDIINLCSLGIPRYSIHHVGIVLDMHDRLLLFESKGLCEDAPCVRSDRPVNGVQSHYLEDVLERTKRCNIWHYSLRCPLYAHEEERLMYYLDSKVGAPYDVSGAIRSGGLLTRFVTKRMWPENTESLFCSEFAADALVHIGRFQTDNVSAWSPNRFTRTLVDYGVCNKAKLLKAA